jgi:hypothetical protein
MTLLRHLALSCSIPLDLFARASFSVCSLIYFIASLPFISRFFIYCLHPTYPSIVTWLPRYNPPSTSYHRLTMCYLVVERYSVCRCLYYKHNIDMCPAYGQQGHSVVERTLLVGYACEKHSNYQQQESSSSQNPYSDSGYGTASHGSHRHSSRRHRR